MGPTPEQTIATLAILAICGALVYGLVFWVMEAPCTADPWGKEITNAINNDDAVPVCHHCFTPQPRSGWFCPECGAIVGPYCNCMPYLYIFSQGEVLRAGVTERLRHGPLIVIGYILVSLATFSVGLVLLAPIYWFLLFKNLCRTESAPSAPMYPAAAQPPQEITADAEVTERDDTETVKKCTWCGKEYSAEATICPIDGNPLIREKRT
jgi:hypothetical protein